MSDKTFGERLVAERKRLGLSATDVFEATGLHRNTQSAYENDKKLPDADYLKQLHTLGFDVLYLVVGTDCADLQPVLGDEERLVLQAYQALPAAMRAAALAFANATVQSLGDAAQSDSD